MSRERIFVCGGTGTVGRSVLRALTARGIAPRATTRRVEQARSPEFPDVDWVEADLADRAGFLNALKGFDGAFLVTPVDENAPRWHANFLNAARRAGVRRVVKLSAMNATPDAPSEILRAHAESDEALRRSGLEFTLIQPNSFFQNLFWSVETIRSERRMYGAYGDASLAHVDVADVAEVVVAALTERRHAGETYELTGPEPLTFRELAAGLSEAVGADIEPVPVPPAAAEQAMIDQGLPSWNASRLRELFECFAGGAFARTTPTVEAVSGRVPTPFREWARRNANAFS